ncbi:hypothetical protein DENIS_2327 [Desulfonema ishimotonii]|uniref:ABC-type transport auxiliary lipoprotein component domain-containing protein n=1 Tax=Desulfonema ishimotonii TaxID=45657 RepID=A0A401FWL4_9BACT|nr:PqiC family protein [Desulfonema ishimotonii]GBC61367.1 hypothetical protein DENIS_2327 [Desulfonema ishimotonii]
MIKTLTRHTFVMISLLLLFSGCGRSGASRFYVLSPMPPDTVTLPPVNTLLSGLTIGVGPVSIPDYLDRPYIVTRSGPHNIRMADFDKWAGALKHDIPRILAENISHQVGTENVVIFPWRNAVPIRYQVTVDIVQMDAEPGGNAVLDARWTLFGKNGREVLTMKKSRITVPIGGTGYTDIVRAESLTLGKLSRDIADTIRNLAAK